MPEPRMQGTGEQPIVASRPRQLSDYAEGALGVTDTTIALRKEELLRLLISGKRTADIAQIMRLGVGTVRTYMRCPEFQRKLWEKDQKLWQQVDEELRVSKLTTTLRIQELSEVALERIAGLMNSDDEAIVYRASADILDRNPEASKHSKHENTNRTVVIPFDALAQALKVEQEMEARNVGPVLDAADTAS